MLMRKNIASGFLLVLVSTLFITGCKPKGGASKATSYFQTPYQDESQFIVETIVSDLAEQIYYGKFHQVPPAGTFRVSADETPDSPFGTPVYDLQIDLDGKHHGLKVKLNVNGPIWAPEVYDGVAAQLAQSVGLAAGSNEESKDTTLLAALTDGKATTIEDENQKLSAALDSDFTNPALHEQAAILLGAFTLREHSGDFFEIRSPLCRITAHLAMARFLEGADSPSINGRMAGVMLSTLMNNEADAVTALKTMPTNSAALASWVRALQARNTGDYRPLDKVDGLSQIECIEWFRALDVSANADIAWSKLSDVQKRVPDFVRIANERWTSVGTGHELLDLSLPVEYEELGPVYQMARQKKLKREELAEALNALPDRCFSAGPDQPTGVHIIGWGLWAGFFQRQLCHAVQRDFYMLQWKWGVPEDAKAFATNNDQLFDGLRLYPFVRRFDAVTVDEYHKSVDDGFKVTVATPQLVPAECWNYLCVNLNRNELYRPNPNPHVNEWHNHNPPPGTAYNPGPRLYHPSLTGRADSKALLNQLHERAPYDWEFTSYIYQHQYHKHPTYQQAGALFAEVLPYSVAAMEDDAETVKDQPANYESLLLRAAEISPAEYFTLANYFADRLEEDKAAGYLEKGTALDPDSVRAASYATWLVKYYLKKGRTEDARKEADFAGEVYSYSGLQAKATFLEATSDYEDAFQWYFNIEDRYDDPGPVVDFCLNYKNKTGDSRFDARLQALQGKIFPNGIEAASLTGLTSAPGDGVLIEGENGLVQAAGLKQGDVIVALHGVRIHSFLQYRYERDLISGPELDVIVWQGKSYNEIKASPPQHLFGVNFGDYPAQR